MKLNIHPIAKIENQVIKTLKNENIIRFASKYRFQLLADQNPRENVPTFQEILNNMSHSIVKLPGKPWEINYTYKESSGTTRIYLHNEYLNTRPTIVFHHGLGRLNPIHIKVFANTTLLERFNFFSIKAANHDSINIIRKKCVNSFTNIASVVAASVLAVDEIVDFNSNNSDQTTSVTGISLGGIVSSLHYFYFNSADFYFPIISYPNFGEIILEENIKEFIANYDSLKKNKSIIDAFAVPKKLTNKPKDKIIPILANSDELISFEKASAFWKGYKKHTFNVGHNTIFIKMDDIRRIILSKVFA